VWSAESNAKPQVVVCLGDSLTAGYGINPDFAYPKLIEDQLHASGHSIKVVNAGISGSTTASGLGRLKWLLKVHGSFDILICALGANDGLRGQDLNATQKNLKGLILKAQDQGVQVILAGMKMPSNYGPTYREAFEALYQDLGNMEGVHLIPFLLEGVAMKPKLNLPDGIHPNPDGHRIIAQTVLEYLKPFLKDPS
jgi:acyl-CoA thioesterase-1